MPKYYQEQKILSTDLYFHDILFFKKGYYMRISSISFTAMPHNYAIIDDVVSRSAQPQKEDFVWLKNQGITDVFNFRTMWNPGVNFDEKKEVEALGMKYHNIPSISARPNEQNVDRFLKEIEEVKAKGGKAHIHCKAGADRTGMYSYIYKALNRIGSDKFNQNEMIRFGHDTKRYPNLIDWTTKLISKLRK